MKTVINISEKISHQPFGSFGASCSLELEIDQAALQSRPDDVLAQIRFAADLCRAAVSRELELTRQRAGAGQPPAPSASSGHGRDAGEDDDAEDLRPGDRGYREPSRRGPDRQQGPPPQRDRAGYGRPPADDADLPTTGRTFAGWLSKQDEDTHRRVRELIRAWNLPGRYTTWHNDDVASVVHELTGVPDSGRSWPGAAPGPVRQNGYHR